MSTKNVIVVGGGAYGVPVAKTLSQKLDPTKFSVILINARPFVFHTIAAPRFAVSPIDNLTQQSLIPYDKVFTPGRGTFKLGKVTSVSDTSITLESGETLAFEALVVATGSNWTGPLDVPETADLSSAESFFASWQEKFKSANDIVLVGGGAVGSEISGEIKDIWKDKNVTIVHSQPKLINDTYPEKFRKNLEGSLKSRGINIVFDDYVDNYDITDGKVTTRKGQAIKADLVVSTIGGKPNATILSGLGSDILTSSGHVKVKPTLQLESHPNIFAAGDIVDWDERKTASKSGAHADVVAANVIASLSAKPVNKAYKGAPEFLVVTNGKSTGTAYLGIAGGWTLGGWFTSAMKGKALLIPMRPAKVAASTSSGQASYSSATTSSRRNSRYNIPTSPQLTPPPLPNVGPGQNALVDGKRPSTSEGNRNRSDRFQYKYGKKHHSLPKDKAPYPVSYDQVNLDLEALNTVAATYWIKDFSLVELPELPKKCLDLGCGTGSWVLTAAKAWTTTKFVGFDLVNIQTPIEHMSPEDQEFYRGRVEWVHGNFLTSKLPFEDEEFDHVHIRYIAWGVPESKWDFIFEEVHRVLKSGGAIECVEEDIVFPVLPKSYTEPFRKKSSQQPDTPSSATNSPTPDQLEHEHALLESLFYSVFTNRSINLRPTAIVPGSFIPWFSRVRSPPNINVPLPTLPPPRPLPDALTLQYQPQADRSELLFNGEAPARQWKWNGTGGGSGARPQSQSFSSLASYSSMGSNNHAKFTSAASSTIFGQDFDSRPSSDQGHGGEHSPLVPPVPFSPSIFQNGRDPESEALASALSNHDDDDTLPVLDSVGIGSGFNHRTGFNEAAILFSQTGRPMALHKAYQMVLACKEAMFEELEDRLINNKADLERFGWESDEDLQNAKARAKFDILIERYQSDMQNRISLWKLMTDAGFQAPPREPLSKSEMVEEERLQEAVAKARLTSSAADLANPIRCLRIITGFKDSITFQS